MSNRFRFMKLVLAVTLVSGTGSAQQRNRSPQSPVIVPKLINTCLITNQVKSLVTFYEAVLGIKAQWAGEDYAEFRTGVGVLAIFSMSAQERYIPKSAVAGRNDSAILEFRVANVDQEFQRLQTVVKTWVKSPTTQPWGTRSFYFRDPDGNLVDFFTRLPPKQ